MAGAQLQVVDISFPLGELLGPAYCPMCGKCTYDSKTLKPNPCEHVELILTDEPEYMSERFAQVAAKFENEQGVSPFFSEYELDEALVQLGYAYNCMLMSLTAGGNTCGPIFDTMYYLFDFSNTSEQDLE